MVYEGRLKIGDDWLKIEDRYLRIGPLPPATIDVAVAGTVWSIANPTGLIGPITVPLGALVLIAVHVTGGPLVPDAADITSPALSGVTFVDEINPTVGGIPRTAYILRLFKALGTGVSGSVTFAGGASPIDTLQVLISAASNATITLLDSHVIAGTEMDTTNNKVVDASIAGDFEDIWTCLASVNTHSIVQEYGTGFGLSTAWGADSTVNDPFTGTQQFTIRDGAHNDIAYGDGDNRWRDDWLNVGGGGQGGYLLAASVKHNRL